jgi:transposase
MKHTDARRLSPEAQEAIRLRVADFLRMKKGTQGEAADIFQLSLSCVKKIWKQCKGSGRKALKVKKRGPQQQHGSRLTKQQVKQVKTMMKMDTPDGYQIASSLWTASAVRLLLKKSQCNLQHTPCQAATERLGLYLPEACLQCL